MNIELATRNQATQRFALVYADPPWSPGQTSKRGASEKYDLMSTEDICRMPVGDLAADNSVCLLWVVSNGLQDGLDVLKAWGFRYVTIAVWDKYYMGLGNHFRGSHEILLLGVKGSVKPKFRGQKSVFQEPRLHHSSKPQEVIQKIVRMYDGPYLELFSRQRPNCRERWAVWGNQIASDVFLPGFPVPEYTQLGLAHRALTEGRDGR
ncbi:MAG: MT-A70 family methyltransferase [Aeromicrobium sp.]